MDLSIYAMTPPMSSFLQASEDRSHADCCTDTLFRLRLVSFSSPTVSYPRSGSGCVSQVLSSNVKDSLGVPNPTLLEKRLRRRAFVTLVVTRDPNSIAWGDSRGRIADEVDTWCGPYLTRCPRAEIGDWLQYRCRQISQEVQSVAQRLRSAKSPGKGGPGDTSSLELQLRWFGEGYSRWLEQTTGNAESC